jgi:SHS family lactate transporter-like MFS transporter
MAWWKEPTKGQWFTLLAAWVGWILDAFDFTIFLLVIPEISKEFGASLTVTVGAITATQLTRLLGGFVAGSLADKFGRKLPLMISLVWFAVCDGAIAFAPSFAFVMICRTLFGFGMGAEWTAGTTLAMENWPKRSRGIASGILQGSWAIGYLLAGLVAGWVVPAYGWRALFIIAAVPALLVLPIRIWVPESEEWKLQQAASAASVERKVRVPLSSVLGKLGWGAGMMGAGLAAYYSLTALYPTVLKIDRGLDPAAVGTIIALFNVGMMLGSIACGWIAANRSVAWAIAAPALLVIPFLPLYVGEVPGWLGAGAFFGGFFGAGYAGVTPMMLATLFPAEIRARATGIVYHVGAFGAAFLPMGLTAIAASAGVSLAQVMMLSVALFQLILVGLLTLRPKELRKSSEGEPALATSSLAH